jgi:hypothetical protein
VLTSVTGFGFPFDQCLPSHIIGILSLLVLALAILARYVFHLAGRWRWVDVVGASPALSRNAFVLIVQIFLKVPAFKALAPTRKEPPFLIAQLSVMASFIALTILAARRFHLEPTRKCLIRRFALQFV